MSDLIERQAAKHELYKMLHDCFWADDEEQDAVAVTLDNLPSVQPEPSEITDEQAILHLQSTGWMQNHDREMYESGLRERLADDRGDYDSLIPCKDAISRQAVREMMCVKHCTSYLTCNKSGCYKTHDLDLLPSVQPEVLACGSGELNAQYEQRWIPIEKELPPVNKTVLLSHRSGVTIGWYNGMSFRTNTSARCIRTVKAWIPLPEQYRGEGD